MSRYAFVAAAVALLPVLLVLVRVDPSPPGPEPPPADPEPRAPATPSPAEEPPVTVMDFTIEPLADPPDAPMVGARRPPAARTRPGKGPRRVRRTPRPPLHEGVDPDGDGLVGAVNLNTASVRELVVLPGMGPKRARALIELRERRRLSHARQVQRIRGVGPKTYRRWRSHIKVRGDNTLRRVKRPGGRRAARG